MSQIISVRRLRTRLPLAASAALATATLYAEGVLKNGWIEVALLAPVFWFALGPGPRLFLGNLLLSLIALCLTVSGVDLILRPVLSQRLHYTPTNIAARKLPELPIVGRWDANLVFDVQSYGDLAAIAGDPSLREPRRIVFQTDGAGFRNGSESGLIDTLILGDSFGAGAGTSEEHIFARLLETRYGRRTYNLSYPGGPYDQYVNFAIETSRLGLATGAQVIWTFYTGNDLDDAGGEIWDIDRLPWRSEFSAWLVRYRTFRNRSPLNQWMEALRLRMSIRIPGIILRELPDGRPVLFQENHEAWGKRSRSEVEQHPNFAKLQRTMEAMQTLVLNKGVGLTVLILPTKGEVYRWILDRREPKPEDARSSGFAQAVLALCKRVRLRCLDAKPYLTEEAWRVFESSGELLWWRDDTHLGKRGHAAVAALIAGEILHVDQSNE